LEIYDITVDINYREQYWIDKLNSMCHSNGWNIDYIDMGGVRREHYRPNSKPTKSFKVMSPTGEIFEGNGIKPFARLHKLDYGGFNKLANGKIRYLKGWKSLHPDAILIKDPIHVISPSNEEYVIENISEFIKEHNLVMCNGNFRYMLSGKYKQCKGWRLINTPSLHTFYK
jgi:hypothetical protein